MNNEYSMKELKSARTMLTFTSKTNLIALSVTLIAVVCNISGTNTKPSASLSAFRFILPKAH